MDERKIAKDALKTEYLKEIVSESSKKLNLKEDALFIDNQGEIMFPRTPIELYSLVRFLANELANTKAELWLQIHSNKE